MANAIDIQHIGKSYDGHVAVRDLSLQVPEGSVYGLLGPNGAGKTTTIRMILDIIRPDKGSIALFGRPSTEAKVRDAVGYLPNRPLQEDAGAAHAHLPRRAEGREGG
jgi:ABC-2 type transport system ATP-binding protein